MSKNTDVIRELYVAFGNGDIPAVLGALVADVQWTEAAGGPYGGTYVGPEAVLESVFMKFGTEWEDFTAVHHELVSEGETVVALGEYSGTFKATGKSFRAPFAHVWKLRDGKITAFHQHTDTALHIAPMRAS